MAEYTDSDYISRCAISNLFKDIQGDIERRFECYRLPSPTADVIPLEKIKELRSLALRVKHNTGSIDTLIDTVDKLIAESEVER